MHDEKVIEVATKLHYLEASMHQIQEVAVQQTKDIEKLKVENKILKDKVKDLSDWAEGDIPNRKPPHY